MAQIISIGNKCTDCEWCTFVSKGAIDFSQVDSLALREAAYDAEENGDYTQVSHLLGKVVIDPSRLTLEMVQELKESCYREAFHVVEY